MKKLEPEIAELSDFLREFNNESDRGAALTAASMLDELLKEILNAYLADVPERDDLLVGFYAPLGTFSSRTSAVYALGLIQQNEYEEIKLIRKIRNEFGHKWKSVSFNSGRVADFCRQLPWLGPSEYEAESTLRGRFNAVVTILLSDLLWRVRLVAGEQRVPRTWPNTIRKN